jgi:N-acetylglucosaminyl-diphospho-decaprenol L-rhamnosyltransferase
MRSMKISNRVATVVSAHRPYATLDSCLRGLRAIMDQDEDLIFVNNGASASLNQLVSGILPGITIINLSENRFFCAGYNAGIRTALERNYDFVLIVNADTEVVNPSFVNELLAAARRWPKAAFLGPLVYYRNRETLQNTCLRYPFLVRNILTWIPWRIFPALFDHSPSGEKEVEFLNGVCVLCRCTALRDFGLMDERYGGYIEDADWSWRARKNGWSSVYIPVPSIIHHEEQEGYEYFSFKSYLLKRNTVLWHLKAGYRISAFLYALASISLAGLRMLVAQNKSDRRMHRQFLRRLISVYRSMIFGTPQSSGSGFVKLPEECGLEMWR